MARGHITIIDDDPDVRKGLARLMSVTGYTTEVYPSAEAFLLNRTRWKRPGCLLLDVHMPGIDGLVLQQRIMCQSQPLPIIFLTGHGNIPMSVRAMKAGAVDFLLKPFDPETLLKAVGIAVERDAETHEVMTRHQGLTVRERQVFTHLLTGKLNKETAESMGISEKTVKYHRANVLRKFKVKSVVELVHIANKLGIEPTDSGVAQTTVNG